MQPDSGEHGRSHVQRGQGIAGRVHSLDQCKSGVGAPVDVGDRCLRRKGPENEEAEQAQGRDPDGVVEQGAQMAQHRGCERDVHPQRDVDRIGPGCQGHPMVQPQHRHLHRRLQGVLHHGEVGPEKREHEGRGAQHLEHPQAANAPGEVGGPRRCHGGSWRRVEGGACRAGCGGAAGWFMRGCCVQGAGVADCTIGCLKNTQTVPGPVRVPRRSTVQRKSGAGGRFAKGSIRRPKLKCMPCNRSN